jgi:hypothetical protein
MLKARRDSRTFAIITVAALVGGLIVLGPMAGVASAAASTFQVQTTSNTADNNPGDGICDTTASAATTPCTLYAAIQEANAHAGPDNITFALASPYRITLTSVGLPAITSPVVIDGTSQPGFNPGTGVIPRVDGATNTVGCCPNGLTLDPGSDGSTIKGLEIVRMYNIGITVNSGGNTISGTYLGTTAAGAATCTPNTSTCGTGYGIQINDGVGNLIGGTTAAERNVISNNNTAIYIPAATPASTTITGNYIGTKPDGATALPNSYGIYAVPTNAGAVTTIGGTAPGAGNVISGHTSYNLYLSGGSGSVAGNLIGVNAAGSTAVTGSSTGVYLQAPAHDWIIGGATAAHRNVISASNDYGVRIQGGGISDGFTVRGNYLGLNAAGTAAIPNNYSALDASSTDDLSVRDNVVGGNSVYGYSGISVNSTKNASISGNTVGLAANGSGPLPGFCSGIALNNSTGADVSGNTIANLYCGNEGIGVSSSADTTVNANRVGTDVTGSIAKPNPGVGIRIANNSVDTMVVDNVIANSGSTGLVVSSSPTSTIRGNRIGTNAAGTAAMANSGGISLSGSDDSVIGGVGPGDGNLVSGNSYDAIRLEGGSDDVAVLGNLVGIAADGVTPLANAGTGLLVYDGDRTQVGGTGTGEGNMIANNTGAGVVAYQADRVSVRGNSMYNNGSIAIDLNWNSAPDANDTDDPDLGANRLQNYPVLASAASNASGTQVKGSLNSRPSTAYTLDFYSNPACDSSGNGEAKTVLGTKQVTTDAGGDVAFTADLPLAALLGASISATATDPQGRTSELSACVTNSVVPTVSISPTTASPSEGAGTQAFTVSLSAGSAQTTSVMWQTADGTATSADYTSQSAAVLTFAPGETSKAISVPITGDTLDEDNEAFTVSLSSPDNALIAAGQGSSTVTIVDDDALPTLSVADAPNVTETSGGTQTFTVNLSTASSKTVTVTAATESGTATSPADFTATAVPLAFAPGETVKTVNVTYVDDQVDEANEVYRLRLHGPTNATLGDGVGDGTILDDDTDPTISVTPANPSVGEAAGPAGFNVTLSQSSTKTVTVAWQTAAGTAASGTDYTAQAPAVLTFAPGVTTLPISVAITNDALDEPNETFLVTLSSPSESTINVGSTTATIVDDDATPTLAVADATGVSETPGGVTQSFTVSLSAVSGQTVQVAAATSGGTAIEGTDYTSVEQLLTFLPGETTKTVNVSVLDDFENEATETYELHLGGPVNATIADGTGVASIADNDAYPTVSIAATNSPVAEGSGATFTATLSGAYGANVTVSYRTVNGTAASGTDYTASAPTTLTFTPGQTTKPISVNTTNDTLDEDDETFSVVLSNPGHATVLNDTATATVTDNDATPTVSIATPTPRTEGTGANLHTFTLSLSAASGRTVQVAAGTATSALVDPATPEQDFLTKAALITFNPGETSKTFVVTIVDDPFDEANQENYEVRLYTPTNATIGTGTVTAKITDNDAAPTATINDVSILEGSSSTVDLVFTVTLSAGSDRAVRFKATTADGTAIGGTDYIALNKVVNVPVRTTTVTVAVRVKGNTVAEPNETFAIDLVPLAFVTFTDAQGVGTILNDD